MALVNNVVNPMLSKVYLFLILNCKSVTETQWNFHELENNNYKFFCLVSQEFLTRITCQDSLKPARDDSRYRRETGSCSKITRNMFCVKRLMHVAVIDWRDRFLAPHVSPRDQPFVSNGGTALLANNPANVLPANSLFALPAKRVET